VTKPARWNAKRAQAAIPHGGLDNHLDIASDPEFATHNDPLKDEVVVGQFFKNRRKEHVRLTLKRFEGRPIADLRQFFVTKDGFSQPTTKGIALVVARLPDLAAIVNRAVKRAIELGLLTEEDAK
jgi:Transcriptional Coactivator p15 (PC4)